MMGDPPANDKLYSLEWTFEEGRHAGKTKSAIIMPGMTVNAALHQRYWNVHLAHSKLAELHAKHGLPLPNVFIIFTGGPKTGSKPIGYGHYLADDPHHRAFVDCAVYEAEERKVNLAMALDPAMQAVLAGMGAPTRDLVDGRMSERRM
jgi:hypothetical protein